jgi:hypothetical protein
MIQKCQHNSRFYLINIAVCIADGFFCPFYGVFIV